MDDLISRVALQESMKAVVFRNVPVEHQPYMQVACEVFVQLVNDAPTINAEPVRHGRWIDEIEPNAVTASGREIHVFRCSACDFTWANKTAVLHYFKYCPNCGAKMDLEVSSDA